MEADAEKVPRHLGYNLAAMSFSAGGLATEIKNRLPDFGVHYSPDERQKIADSWPMSIDDSPARQDWGWKAEFDLRRMTSDMLSKLAPRLKKQGKDV